MDDFNPILKNDDLESAREEVLLRYRNFCQKNPVICEIQETTDLETLRNICIFMYGLSVFLKQADFIEKAGDCSAFLHAAARQYELD